MNAMLHDSFRNFAEHRGLPIAANYRPRVARWQRDQALRSGARQPLERAA
jgi:hypothetical protein